MHVQWGSLISTTDLMHFMFGRVRFPSAYLGNSLPAPRCTTNWHSNMGNNLRMRIIKLTVIVFLLLLHFQNPNGRDAQMYRKYAKLMCTESWNFFFIACIQFATTKVWHCVLWCFLHTVWFELPSFKWQLHILQSNQIPKLWKLQSL